MGIWHWFLTVTGTNNTSGLWYGFWSGFGSDLSEFAILGSIFVVYKHHKCVTCWRIGHVKVDGTPYKTCHKHATVDSHQSIRKKHAKDFPKQHELYASLKDLI